MSFGTFMVMMDIVIRVNLLITKITRTNHSLSSHKESGCSLYMSFWAMINPSSRRVGRIRPSSTPKLVEYTTYVHPSSRRLLTRMSLYKGSMSKKMGSSMMRSGPGGSNYRTSKMIFSNRDQNMMTTTRMMSNQAKNLEKMSQTKGWFLEKTRVWE